MALADVCGFKAPSSSLFNSDFDAESDIENLEDACGKKNSFALPPGQNVSSNCEVSLLSPSDSAL